MEEMIMKSTGLFMIMVVIFLSFAVVGIALAADNAFHINTLSVDIGAEFVTHVGAEANDPPPETNGSRSGIPDTTPPVVYLSPASFNEGFDNINNLLYWYMQNNSEPLGSMSWFQGNAFVFPAHAGAASAYIAVNYNSTTDLGTISNWLLTPQLTLRNGETFRFWTRTATDSMYPDRLQVRLSTAGPSMNVGTSATDVGDFNILLLDVNPSLEVDGYPEVWTQFSVVLSDIPDGTSGRFAFRYFVTDAGTDGSNGNYIGIDTVQYTHPTPSLAVNPLSLHATQPPDRISTQQLQICSIGGAPLYWTVSESPASQGEAILLIESVNSITNSLRRALNELDYTYNFYHGADWTSLDFSPYDIVIAGMDGGVINQPSLQKARTEIIDAGKRLIFFGGTCLQNFAMGVNQYLVQNNTTEFCWKKSAIPHFTIVDPASPLAQGLSSPYNFVIDGATWYSIRVTDPNIDAVAVNGDGYTSLFHKIANFPLIQGGAPLSRGDLIWFIHSPFDSYWSNPGDYAYLKQVLNNAIEFTPGMENYWPSENFGSETLPAGQTSTGMDVPVASESWQIDNGNITPLQSQCGSDDNPTTSMSYEPCLNSNSPPDNLAQTPTNADSSTDPFSRVAPKASNRPSNWVHPNSPVEYILAEGFEANLMPPASWTRVQTNPAFTWKISTIGTSYEGIHSADVEYDPDLVPQNEVLFTPVLNPPIAILDFWSSGSLYWCRETHDNCDLNIWIVIGAWDGGMVDDIFVGEADADWTGNFIWSNSTFDLTPLLPGVPFRIAFQYIGVDGAQIKLDAITLADYLPWLSENPTSGAIPAGACSNVDVTFDSTGLAMGDYFATLQVESNDPDQPIVNVFVSLRVANTLYLPLIQKH